MLVVAEIEEGMDVLIGDKYDVAAVAAEAAVRTAYPVEFVPVNTLAAFAAVAGLNVYLGFVYEHVIYFTTCTMRMGVNLTLPSAKANSELSLATPTLRPALNFMPSCFTMMLPAVTFWPPYVLTPRVFGWPSRPLTTCAISFTSSYYRAVHQHVYDFAKDISLTLRRHLAQLGILEPRLLACHCVHLTPEDIALLQAADVKVSHNPESNMKLASGVAPVPDLLAAGVCVGLGTDGCASNNNLDLFGEMDTAAKLHKVHRLDPTVLRCRPRC